MTLRLNGSTSGYTEIDAPAVAGSNTLVLPTGNGTARQTMMTDGAGVLSFASDAGALYYRLNSDFVGTALTNAAQPTFGVGVTLAASTVYAFDSLFALVHVSGTQTHSMGLSFGGTATVNNIGYSVINKFSLTSLTNNVYTDVSHVFIDTAANTTYRAATQNGFICHVTKLSGTVSINAGGTFIPQYTTSTGTGAYTTQAGSYIRFVPIGAAGSNSSQGTWS